MRSPEYISVACPAAFLWIRFVDGHNGPVVAEISASCPVRSLVRVGDLVTAIDDTDLRHASHNRLTDAMARRRARGAPFTLSLARGGGAGAHNNTTVGRRGPRDGYAAAELSGRAGTQSGGGARQSGTLSRVRHLVGSPHVVATHMSGSARARTDAPKVLRTH